MKKGRMKHRRSSAYVIMAFLSFAISYPFALLLMRPDGCFSGIGAFFSGMLPASIFLFLAFFALFSAWYEFLRIHFRR